MPPKTQQEPQQPLILRAHRLMEAFAKSDDERDFYLDRLEGYIIYVDLDHSQQELDNLEKELLKNAARYCAIPKLTFYETKKIMEGFVNEKVYDIDTKEKLLDIIQSKEARANFLEFIYDHHSEFEKWQQYYQERSRIRIIEWLRQNHFHFVFEEDLDLTKSVLERLKQSLFDVKVGKEVTNSRKILLMKAKTYYSNEALNPRPKRGRPPKQTAKQEIEPQISSDIYLTVSEPVRPFLFTPEISGSAGITFSADFGDGESLLGKRSQINLESNSAEGLQQKLATLRNLSSKWIKPEASSQSSKAKEPFDEEDDFSDDFDEDEEDLDDEFEEMKPSSKKSNFKKATAPKAQKPTSVLPKVKAKQKPKPAKEKPRRIIQTPPKAGNAAKTSQKPKRILPLASKAKPLQPVLGSKVKPKAQIKGKPLPKKTRK